MHISPIQDTEKSIYANPFEKKALLVYPQLPYSLLQNICSNGKLDFAAINVLVVVQNNSFYPAAGDDDDLKYANGFFHRISLLSALVLGLGIRNGDLETSDIRLQTLRL